MSMPRDVKIIDLMMGIPGEDNSGWYEFIRPMLMDEESHTMFKMPAQYMFKDIPKAGRQPDYVAYVIEQMDRHNIERSMIGIDDDNKPHLEALQRRPAYVDAVVDELLNWDFAAANLASDTTWTYPARFAHEEDRVSPRRRGPITSRHHLAPAGDGLPPSREHAR